MLDEEEKTWQKKQFPGILLKQEIDKDLAEGVCIQKSAPDSRPNPTGYLHIRARQVHSVKTMDWLKKYNGTFHLRFDDTNPTKEDMEFVESIKEDVKWLGGRLEGSPLFCFRLF